MKGKPWFGGERTLAQQMVGPDALLPHAKGKTVLDLACAEGLISLEFLKAGATRAWGFDLVPDRVRAANHNCAGRQRSFTVADLDTFAVFGARLERFDIVLALSIAHKLKRPERFLTTAASTAREYLAIRLPHPIIDDRRSDHRKVDVPALMAASGFYLWQERRGTYDEWNGIFRRADAAD